MRVGYILHSVHHSVDIWLYPWVLVLVDVTAARFATFDPLQQRLGHRYQDHEREPSRYQTRQLGDETFVTLVMTGLQKTGHDIDGALRVGPNMHEFTFSWGALETAVASVGVYI